MSLSHSLSLSQGRAPLGAMMFLMLMTLVMGCPPDFQDDECQVNSDCFTDEVCEANLCILAPVVVPTVSTFTATPATVASGQSVTLTWSMVDVESATIVGGDFSLSVPAGDLASGSTAVEVSATTTFTLTANNGDLSDQATAIVTVDDSMAPVIASFEASASPVDSGAMVTLTWQATGATSGRLEYDDQVVDLDATALDSGTQVVTPTADTTYTLVLINATGTTQDTVDVEINAAAPEVTSFVGPQSPIESGSAAALSWEVSDAQSLALVDDQGVAVDITAEDVASGSVMVSPTVTTTYTLTATNAQGEDTATAVVVVNEALAVVSFLATPDTVSVGQPVTLSWTLTGTPSAVTLTSDLPETISLSGVADLKNGSIVVTPTRDLLYTLTITDGATTESSTAMVTVLPNAPVINQLDASPNSVSAGGIATLIWQVDGATQLSLVDDQGVMTDITAKNVVSDNVNVTVAANTTYTLTATNAGGMTTRDVSVVVGDLVTISSFDSSSNTVFSGDVVTLSWDIANATVLSLTDQNNQIISLAGKMLTTDSIDVTPTTPASTYTLVAQGFGGPVSQSVTITVNPLVAAILSFDVDKVATVSGEDVVLSWTTEQTSGLTLTDDQGQSVDISALSRDGDSVTLSPQVTTVYTLTATDGVNSPTDTVTVTVSSAPLLITEVLANPTGVNDQREWIEIHNTGDTFVDLSQYTVAVGGADWTAGQVALSGTIAPQGCVVVGGPTSDVDNFNPTFDVATDFSPDLGDGGAVASGVALFFGTTVGAADAPIDAIVYGDANTNGLLGENGAPKVELSATPAVGQSLVRTAAASDVFGLSLTPTPGTCINPVVSSPTRGLTDIGGTIEFSAYGVDLDLVDVNLGAQTLTGCIETSPEQYTCTYAANAPSGSADFVINQVSEYVPANPGVMISALAMPQASTLTDAFFFEGRIMDPGAAFLCGLSVVNLISSPDQDAFLEGQIYLQGVTDAAMPLGASYLVEMAAFTPGTIPYEDNSIVWTDATASGFNGNSATYTTAYNFGEGVMKEGALRVSPNLGVDYYYCDTLASGGSDDGWMANGGTMIVWAP